MEQAQARFDLIRNSLRINDMNTMSLVKMHQRQNWQNINYQSVINQHLQMRPAKTFFSRPHKETIIIE